MSRLALPFLVAAIALATGCGQESASVTSVTDEASPAAEQQAPTTTESDPAASTTETQAGISMEAGESLDTGEDDTEEASVQTALASQSAPTRTAPTTAYRQGVHYKILTPTQPTSSAPDKIEVAELFWYGCPHCYSFEPYVSHYLTSKPANVEFVRIPATLNRGWQIHARAYYTAEVLGVLDKVHTQLFQEIHVNKNSLGTEDELAEFFASHGVDEKAFRDAFRSFAVDTKLRRADTLSRRYRVTGVPAVVVNGKYTTGAAEAQGYDNLLKLIDYLVQLEDTRS